MIVIQRNAKWKNLENLFSKDIIKKYDWFLWEFGRRITILIHEHLLGEISKIPGTEEYKKRMVLAELRDKSSRPWWIIIAKARPLSEGEYSTRTSIISVVDRYNIGVSNPVADILQKYGPWTIDTMPFIPSDRQAVVTIKTVSPALVKQTAERNRSHLGDIKSLMQKHKITFEPTYLIQQKLSVIEDLDVEAIKMEFGQSRKGAPHWRPTLRWAVTQGVRQIKKDKELMSVFTNPNFKGYNKRRNFEFKLRKEELAALESFQKKIRRSLIV